jgi:hypothetical protein
MKKIGETIWTIETKFKFMGADFGNRMTIVRLNNGGLLLHSPIKFDNKYLSQLKALGNVSYLVTPNNFHGMHIQDWQKHFPQAQHYSALNEKGAFPLSQLESDIDDNNLAVIRIQGLPKVNEYAFIHTSSKTLILTDLAFNVGTDVSWWTKVFFTLNGAYNVFGPTRLMRSMLSDPYALKLSMDDILFHDIQRVIVSHGKILESHAKPVLKHAFESLYVKQESKKFSSFSFSKCG